MKLECYSQGRIFPLMLVLALFLNPFGYAICQEAEPAPSMDPQASGSASSQAPAQTDPSYPAATSQNPGQAPTDQLPDSAGAARGQSEQGTTQPAPQPEPPQAQPPTQNRSHEPVGTAAAESVPTSGVAASRPAGAALAPAKQRRIRSILIKAGALVGIGVAVGATMALSEGSPSKPPGAH